MKTEKKTPALGLIAFIVFIDMAGIGLIVPVMPRLVMGLSGEGVDRAAEVGGWLLFSYAIMQFIFSPIIGGLSDRFGRRPILLFTLAALGVDTDGMGAHAGLAFHREIDFRHNGRDLGSGK